MSYLKIFYSHQHRWSAWHWHFIPQIIRYKFTKSNMAAIANMATIESNRPRSFNHHHSTNSQNQLNCWWYSYCYYCITVGSAKFQKLLVDRYTKSKRALKDLLAKCRRVTICLDGWTAKGLASTYLGISACFFDQASYKPMHATLNLYRLPHPHTAIAISDALEKCLKEWNIGRTSLC